MTYAQCKRRALELIFQYSLNGTVIPSTYNGQADYINRIPALVNQSQMEIATTVRPIEASCAVSSLQRNPGDPANVYLLPNDCFRVMDGGLLRLLPDGTGREKNYRLVMSKRIFIPPCDFSGLYLEYFRYPITLPDNPSDSAELDNAPETQECVPYYVAAELIQYDDTYRYTALLDEYRQRLAKIRSKVFVESGLTQNVYE